jgi:hypothetical protein
MVFYHSMIRPFREEADWKVFLCDDDVKQFSSMKRDVMYECYVCFSWYDPLDRLATGRDNVGNW